MKFNRRLIETIPAENRGLAMLALFCIQENLNLIGFLEDPQSVTKVQDISNRLWATGKVVEDLTGKHNDIVTAEPLYVEDYELPEDFNIEKLRKHWSYKSIGIAGKMSDKRRVTALLESWFLENPGVTMKQVSQAGKDYIDHCRNTGRFIVDVDNFILRKDETGEKSLLSTWVEQLDDKTYVDNDERTNW